MNYVPAIAGPLNCPAIGGHTDVTKLLEKKAKIDLQDQNGETALHNSAFNGKLLPLQNYSSGMPRSISKTGGGNSFA